MAQMHQDIVDDLRRKVGELESRLSECRAERDEALSENARLIGELRTRTDDLHQSLEYQTATSDVLKVISRSTADLQPVLDGVIDTAVRLCAAEVGLIANQEGRVVATFAFVPEFEAMVRDIIFKPGRGSVTGRALLERHVVHIADIAADPEYAFHQVITVGRMRTALAVPLLRQNEPVGVIYLARQRVEPFAERQIELVRTFADQAVIAIGNARLITETREALEQQTATAEVLGVINSSPGDLAPVFDAMLEKAERLCEAVYGTIMTFDGEFFATVAVHGKPQLVEKLRQLGRIRAQTGSLAHRLASGERIVHIVDAADDDAYRAGSAPRRAVVEAGVRTLLGVALRKDGALVGLITLYREDVRPFSDKQIGLLENFAVQAVIAMENARLITETREALEQQTATSEILGIISSSPGRLEPVFDALLANAVRMCGGIFGMLALHEDRGFRGVAAHGIGQEFPATLSRLGRPPPGTGLDTLEKGLQTVQVTDAATDPAYRPVIALNPAFAKLRTALHVPMLRDGVLVGAILIYRDQVQRFEPKQVELVENFAKQAIIAIENTRLITETREALEHQTATAEILGVINSSPGDLKPVFDAILEKAHKLCGAEIGALLTYDGKAVRLAAERNLPPAWADVVRGPWLPRHDHPVARIIRGERLFQIEDMAEIARTSDDPVMQAAVELGGIRSLLLVPLRKDGAFLGYITAYRQEVRPFTEKQIALLENFAAQAVIAMENARLITETREALEQQTATAEVLQVINSSPGDLIPVFQAILEKAHALCAVELGSLQLYDGEQFRAVAVHGLSDALADRLKQGYAPSHKMPTYRLIEGAPFVQVPDLAEVDDPMAQAAVALGGTRTHLFVALRKDGALLGQIVAARKEVRPFSDKQVALLQNFAAQAVIAMENARLITETRDALEQQTATAEVLGVINSSPGDLAPVFDAILEHRCTGNDIPNDWSSFGSLSPG